MAVLMICSACGKSNRPPCRFCTSCGAGFEEAEDGYTTEPLDPSLIHRPSNVIPKPVALTPFLQQILGWELNGLQRDQICVIMQTLAEAVPLWQWLWFHYGQHPTPEDAVDASLPELLARLIENSRVRQEALHNLLIVELRSH
jgi:hypothetical protein